MPASDSNPPRMSAMIQSFRKHAHLTQREVADRAGISVGGLRDLEQGRVAAPRATTLRRLATALELSPAEADLLVRNAQTVGGLRIQILGPLVIFINGIPVNLTSDAQRVLLGVLALSANRPVRKEALIKAIWGDDPPTRAVTMLQAHISRLRRRLGNEFAVSNARGGGYRLILSEAQLDLLEFQSLLARARHARSGGDLTASYELYDAAIGLSGGQPLAGLSILHDWPDLVALTRTQQLGLLEFADAAAELGRHDDVLGPLRELADSEPLNESVHARFMVALAGSGQQAAALTVFERLRRRLSNELGVDPGAEITITHQRVLRQQIRSAGTNEPAPVNAYRLLPHDIADFTGRQLDLQALRNQLPPIDTAGTTVVISVIEGTAGVGKTRLAIRFAHELVGAGRYSDLQLYVDLRGYADAPPAHPAAVLGSFLLLLGVSGAEIPADLDSRAALFRDRSYDRRALILLDNAADEAQIEPLLPAGTRNPVLITSRRTLAIDGARPHALAALPEQDAIALLTKIAGPRRIEADPTGALRVVELCGRLPLAIALAAHRLRSRSGWTLADLARLLDEPAGRVGELVAGQRGINAAFDLSYAALNTHCQRLFRLLGIHPGDDFTVESAAALTGATFEATNSMLDHLVDEHLATTVTASRYRLHDLLRAYAIDLANHYPAEATEARERILRWYLYAADAACRAALPRVESGPDAVLDPADKPAQLPTFTAEDAAQRWLDDEKATLIAVCVLARDHDLPEVAWKIALAVGRYCQVSNDWETWIGICDTGLAAARDAADQIGEAAISRSLAVVHMFLMQFDRAVDHATRSVTISRRLGDRPGQARGLNTLGSVHKNRGELNAASACLREAGEIARELGSTYVQALSLMELANVYTLQNRYDEAIDVLEVVLGHWREHDNSLGIAVALMHLGEAHNEAGRHREAIPFLEEGRRIQHLPPLLVAETLKFLGTAFLKTDQPERTHECWTESLIILDELSHPFATDVRSWLDDLERSQSTAG